MKISIDIVSKLKPCFSRFDNFVNNYPKFNSDIEEFITLDKISYSDKVWVVTRLFTPMQNLKWAILCASKVLSIFEERYPHDKRPRLALEAAEAYLNEPTAYATYAASTTAYAAYAATAAAYAAATNAAAAYAAAYAANATTYATAYAATATAAANAAATAAAYAAAAAATTYAAANATAAIEEDVNLILMLECFQDRI